MTNLLQPLISELSNQNDLIPASRRDNLKLFAETIRRSLEKSGHARIIIICTHNSRRSQLAEAWINALAHIYQKPGIKAYSGGIEVTAFNENMVKAMRTCGFHIEQLNRSGNPLYLFNCAEDALRDVIMFSKLYDDAFNPHDDFIAVTVCDHADENCPYVPGTVHRFHIDYSDPKQFDGTPEAEGAYINKVREIGREMIYVFENIEAEKL